MLYFIHFNSFLRKICFRKFRRGTPPEKVADKLLRTCEDVLGPDKVSEEQVRDLVALLLSSDDAGATAAPDRMHQLDGFGDLNAVSEEENLRAKAIMNQKFESNRILPGEANYKYDVRVDFTPTEVADWDDEDEEND